VLLSGTSMTDSSGSVEIGSGFGEASGNLVLSSGDALVGSVGEISVMGGTSRLQEVGGSIKMQSGGGARGGEVHLEAVNGMTAGGQFVVRGSGNVTMSAGRGDLVLASEPSAYGPSGNVQISTGQGLNGAGNLVLGGGKSETGNGGQISLLGGDSTVSEAGNGGDIRLRGGQGTSGGSIVIDGGASPSAGGSISLIGGHSSSIGVGGSVELSSGSINEDGGNSRILLNSNASGSSGCPRVGMSCGNTYTSGVLRTTERSQRHQFRCGAENTNSTSQQ
jgi:hypothetical protein